MKKLIVVLTVLLVASALVFAGGNGESSGSGKKVVKIGVYEPASGDNGAGGKQVESRRPSESSMPTRSHRL